MSSTQKYVLPMDCAQELHRAGRQQFKQFKLEVVQLLRQQFTEIVRKKCESMAARLAPPVAEVVPRSAREV